MACSVCGKGKGEHHDYDESRPAEIKVVRSYWQAKAHVEPRAPKVIEAIERRIAARLRDGFSPEQLMTCVDVALMDRWYVENGYYRQPEVLWRNAERVQSLLTKAMLFPGQKVPTQKAQDLEDRALAPALAWIKAHGGVVAIREQIRESGKRTAEWLVEQSAPVFVLAVVGHSN